MEQHPTGGTAPPQPDDVDVERLAAWVGALAVVLVEMGQGMRPTAGAYEAAVTVGVGARAIAVAARVEHDGTVWRIVELVPPEAGLHPAGRRPDRADRAGGGTPDRPPTRG